MVDGSIMVPQPDPTLLTTAQLNREIANARELIESKIRGQEAILVARIDSSDRAIHTLRTDADRHIDTATRDLKDVIETRLLGMDKAIALLQSISDRVSANTDEKIQQLRALHQEKFDSISVQFEERDTRTEQTAAGVKIAVDAALQAAKEAVAEQNRSFALATGKSETATMKQIDALGLAIQTANKGLDDKIADMKDRLTRIEGMDLGSSRSRDYRQAEQAVQHGASQNSIAIIAVIIAAAALALALFHYGATPVVVSPTSPPPLVQRQADPIPVTKWPPLFHVSE